MMMVYIGGVPGVGKTAIIRETEIAAKKINLRLERVVGTDIMCRLAGVDTVEKLRRLPENVRKKIRPEMNRLIYAQDEEDPLAIRLCDGHFCFFDFTGEQYGVRQIQPWDRTQMKAFVVILCGPLIILKRRLAELRERPDRKTGLNFIKQEQRIEVYFAKEQARQLAIPVKFWPNSRRENIGEVAHRFLSLVVALVGF